MYWSCIKKAVSTQNALTIFSTQWCIAGFIAACHKVFFEKSMMKGVNAFTGKVNDVVVSVFIFFFEHSFLFQLDECRYLHENKIVVLYIRKNQF